MTKIKNMQKGTLYFVLDKSEFAHKALHKKLNIVFKFLHETQLCFKIKA